MTCADRPYNIADYAFKRPETFHVAIGLTNFENLTEHEREEQPACAFEGDDPATNTWTSKFYVVMTKYEQGNKRQYYACWSRDGIRAWTACRVPYASVFERCEDAQTEADLRRCKQYHRRGYDVHVVPERASARSDAEGVQQ
jgi:hypothetical protein